MQMAISYLQVKMHSCAVIGKPQHNEVALKYKLYKIPYIDQRKYQATFNCV